GVVLDPTGATIPGATIRLLESANGKVRLLKSGAEGRFSLAGLQGGRYDIQISAPGFSTAVRDFSLRERDHAVFSAVLNVGSVAETTEVTAMAPVIDTQSAAVSRRAVMTPPSAKKKD